MDGRELEQQVERDAIDTVLVVFPDLHGRLVGKRVTGRWFVGHLLRGDGAIHACNYLMAVDVDMTPLPGYRFANWEQGYGDFAAVPDLGTLRRIPWLDKTALVVCDLEDEATGEPVEVSPRRILRRQVERAAAMGFAVKCGSELEFFLFKDSFEEAAAKRYQATSFAPTVIVWSYDNRTCGFRIIGHGPSLRVECRIPGADANPYMAFAATIAAGLHGIENKLELPPEFRGDAYTTPGLPRVPANLTEAINALETSQVARQALGDEVVEHYLHSARQERDRFDGAVTDWELRRNFERI